MVFAPFQVTLRRPRFFVKSIKCKKNIQLSHGCFFAITDDASNLGLHGFFLVSGFK
jgi:hypothetical protein